MAKKAMALIAFLLNGFTSGNCLADEGNAKNFLTIATGSVPTNNDPRIQSIKNKLEVISQYCSASRSRQSAGVHDQIAYANSRMRARQDLLILLDDFVAVAKAQCKQIDSSTLLSLYVLERNDGASHSATVSRLIDNPVPLIRKWTSR